MPLSIPDEAIPALATALRPRLTRYIREVPSERQQAYLCLPHLEAFYGGRAFGGKSSGLLMGALQYADVPGCASLILRRRLTDLRIPGALLSRADAWLRDTDARWSAKDMTWYFPKGGTLTFGFLRDDADLDRYQGSEFVYIGFDEAGQFTEYQYRFMFSRLRRPPGVPSWVPLRMRPASNPGGVGHHFLRQRFVRCEPSADRVFVPAGIGDIPGADVEAYRKSLSQVDGVTRARLEDGNWDIEDKGEYFDRTKIRTCRREGPEYHLALPDGGVKKVPVRDCLVFCTMDLAASLKESADYSVVSTFARTPDRELLHIGQFRDKVEKDGQMRALAAEIARHGAAYAVVESNAYQLTFVQDALKAGMPVRGEPSKQKKEFRWVTCATYMGQGRYYVLEGAEWREDFETELVTVPEGHDDQADAASLGAQELSGSSAVHFHTPKDAPPPPPPRPPPRSLKRERLWG